MPHYLIQLTSGRESVAFLRNPRRYHVLTRTAAERAGCSLDGCWFTEEGDGIVAITSVDSVLEPGVLKSEFEKIVPGAQVELTSMKSLRELLDGARDLRLGEALSELTDPVDIASALSFPASDPPSWQSESVLGPGDAR